MNFSLNRNPYTVLTKVNLLYVRNNFFIQDIITAVGLVQALLRHCETVCTEKRNRCSRGTNELQQNIGLCVSGLLSLLPSPYLQCEDNE